PRIVATATIEPDRIKQASSHPRRNAGGTTTIAMVRQRGLIPRRSSVVALPPALAAAPRAGLGASLDAVRKGNIHRVEAAAPTFRLGYRCASDLQSLCLPPPRHLLIQLVFQRPESHVYPRRRRRRSPSIPPGGGDRPRRYGVGLESRRHRARRPVCAQIHLGSTSQAQTCAHPVSA